MAVNYKQLAESRLLPLDGAGNLRDLGGYPTSDGRHVRRGVLYRSGHLHNLTDQDMKFLEGLKLSRIADFRGDTELSNEPDRVPETAIHVRYTVDVAGTDLREKITGVIKGESELNFSDYILGVNREFASKYTPVFAAWIQDLARRDEASPQIFHCTAGKDRTGYAAAVLLKILGVPMKIVLEDYLKTNEYTADFIEKTIRKVRTRTLFRNDGEMLRPLLEVEERYLQNAFNTIDEDWGEFDTYVSNGLGLAETDVQSLKKRFLE
jgi:protein-tyrosine phosphatase